MSPSFSRPRTAARPRTFYSSRVVWKREREREGWVGKVFIPPSLYCLHCQHGTLQRRQSTTIGRPSVSPSADSVSFLYLLSRYRLIRPSVYWSQCDAWKTVTAKEIAGHLFDFHGRFFGFSEEREEKEKVEVITRHTESCDLGLLASSPTDWHSRDVPSGREGWMKDSDVV